MNSVLQRKFVRESTSVPEFNFYNVFRTWLDENYPDDVSQITWDQIRAEDNEIDYETVGNGMTSCPTEVDNTIEIPSDEPSGNSASIDN